MRLKFSSAGRLAARHSGRRMGSEACNTTIVDGFRTARLRFLIGKQCSYSYSFTCGRLAVLSRLLSFLDAVDDESLVKGPTATPSSLNGAPFFSGTLESMISPLV